MRGKELWLVQKNHATVTLESSGRLKTYSEIRIELWNLQILKKCWKSQVSFLSSEQPCEPQRLDVALNITGVEKIRSEKYLRLRSTLRRPFDSSYPGVMNEKSVSSDGRNLFPLSCGWRFSNQFDISVGDTLQLRYSWQWAVALKRTGMIRVGKQGYMFILTDFKKRCFDVSFLTSICVNNYFDTENFLNKLMP